MLLTKSRLEKGLLAISRKFQRLFPPSVQKLTVFFDEETTPYQKPYTPYESTTRECRIYNLRQWFRKHQATVGDWVEVIVETNGYRLIFRKRSQEEAKYRKELQDAEVVAVVINGEERPVYQALLTKSHRPTTLAISGFFTLWWAYSALAGLKQFLA